MTTEIKFQLFRSTGPNEGYQVGELFNSEMIAKNHALHIKDREAQEYKIISIVTTRSTLDVFTVPAHIPTLEEIAEEIIGYADGSFHLDWGDDFDSLGATDQRKVEDMVHQEISNCDHCGWHFSNQNMESGVLSGDWLCYSCANTEQEEVDEEEDESDEG